MQGGFLDSEKKREEAKYDWGAKGKPIVGESKAMEERSDKRR